MPAGKFLAIFRSPPVDLTPPMAWSHQGQVTVDGSEIRRSPVEVGSLSQYLQGFVHPRWLLGISSIENGKKVPITSCHKKIKVGSCFH